LLLKVSNPEVLPVDKPSLVTIYDIANVPIYQGLIDVGKRQKLSLETLVTGVYRYVLLTDRDTFEGVFSYGPMEVIFRRDKWKERIADNNRLFLEATPYLKRLDHLLSLEKRAQVNRYQEKVAYCLYKLAALERNVDNNR